MPCGHRTAYGRGMQPWVRERFRAARVARLATANPAGHPHLVPVVFAAAGDRVWSAVDAKPKSTRQLRRLANIESNPRVSMLVDRYAEDWSALWWVRADGEARVVPDQAKEGQLALAALTEKYPQYDAQPPPGPLILIEVDNWTAWSAR